MIYLFTDFGVSGPYVGLMKSTVLKISPDSEIVDLMHDAPEFNPKASAYLLSSLTAYLLPESIIVAVVDPGVGNPQRRPLMIEADNRWFLGPDNGLFQQVINNAKSVRCYELITEESISKTFHGRDVFAPAAAQLANENTPVANKLDASTLVTTASPDDLTEIIYIDHYGNAITGTRAKNIGREKLLIIDNITIPFAETFSSVKKGELFWYPNSIDLVEISQNSGSAANNLGLSIGKSFGWE